MPAVRSRRPPIGTLTVDDLRFAVRWSRRRRTVGITVARSGELRVAAPAGLAERRLEEAVRAKLPWVRRKLAEFEALGPPPPPLRLVAGERLPYLGRTYPIVIVVDPRRPVSLWRGRFELAAGLDGAASDALVGWYTERARGRVEERVRHFAPLVGASPDGVVVRDLGRRRWGVCDSRRRIVSFHWELALQPPELIDYVVVHELAHLHEPNHGPRFWARVAAVLPDWRRLRADLRTRAQRPRLETEL